MKIQINLMGRFYYIPVYLEGGVAMSNMGRNKRYVTMSSAHNEEREH